MVQCKVQSTPQGSTEERWWCSECWTRLLQAVACRVKVETTKCFLEAPSLKWLVGCALVAWLWWKWLGGGDSWVWGLAALQLSLLLSWSGSGVEGFSMAGLLVNLGAYGATVAVWCWAAGVATCVWCWLRVAPALCQ